MKNINYTWPELAVPLLFTLHMLYLPLGLGPTGKYILSLLLVVVCILHIRRSRSQNNSFRIILLASPVTWMIGLFALAVGISIITSINPTYSFRQFLVEIVLNLLVYFSLATYCATRHRKTDWLKLILFTNAIFLLLYIGTLMQWILHPQHPWLIDPKYRGYISSIAGHISDIIFRYGNANLLVHDTKHTCLFLLLGLSAAFVPLIWNRDRILNILMTCTNMLTLISTIRRGAILASILGMGMTGLLNRKSAKKTMIASVLALLTVIIVATAIISSNKAHYFLHEDWKKIMRGDISSQKTGAIPLRLMCIKLYGEKIMKHPFLGVGFGKRNIKEAYPELHKKLNLAHPHNILLNFACETGIQGSIALILVIGAQAMMFWKCFKTTRSEDIKIIMATALVYMFMFWLVQMTTYGFRHGASTAYWLFTAIPTGYAMAEHPDIKNIEKSIN